MLFVACLITFLPVSAAADGAYNVQVTSSHVTATAKCSDGTSGYYYHTATFKNYCPHCHSYGTLTFNPKGTVEGEWTCKSCDADYCAADGKEKLSGSSYYLSSYTPPKQVKAAQEVKVVKTQQPTQQKESAVQPTQESAVQPVAEPAVQPQPVDPKTKMLNILDSFKGKSFLAGL